MRPVGLGSLPHCSPFIGGSGLKHILFCHGQGQSFLGLQSLCERDIERKVRREAAFCSTCFCFLCTEHRRPRAVYHQTKLVSELQEDSNSNKGNLCVFLLGSDLSYSGLRAGMLCYQPSSPTSPCFLLK